MKCPVCDINPVGPSQPFMCDDCWEDELTAFDGNFIPWDNPETVRLKSVIYDEDDYGIEPDME